jgi:hypothetical protein
LVLNALLGRAFILWVELFSVNYLVYFGSTGIACKYGNLDTRTNISSTSDDTFHCDESTNLGCLDVSHSDDLLFLIFSGSNCELVVPLQVGRDLTFGSSISLSLHTICGCLLSSLLEVELSLVHDNFSGSQILFSEVDSRCRHVLIDDF